MVLRSMGRAVVRLFVVRTYRATPDKPNHLLGEAGELARKVKSFRNLEELSGDTEPPQRQETRAGRANKEVPGGD